MEENEMDVVPLYSLIKLRQQKGFIILGGGLTGRGTSLAENGSLELAG
jgi:hypothetical protein